MSESTDWIGFAPSLRRKLIKWNRTKWFRIHGSNRIRLYVGPYTHLPWLFKNLLFICPSVQYIHCIIELFPFLSDVREQINDQVVSWNGDKQAKLDNFNWASEAPRWSIPAGTSKQASGCESLLTATASPFLLCTKRYEDSGHHNIYSVHARLFIHSFN